VAVIRDNLRPPLPDSSEQHKKRFIGLGKFEMPDAPSGNNCQT
jgi:hypothetical protein